VATLLLSEDLPMAVELEKGIEPMTGGRVGPSTLAKKLCYKRLPNLRTYSWL
jgi:hypothetical protein